MTEKKQTTGLGRNCIDKYYTRQSVVEACMREITSRLDIKRTDVLLEPSAGSGAFVAQMRDLSDECLFYDIEPEANDIVRQDFLTLDTTALTSKRVHVIGNPPFGRQSSMAIKFIKKCCTFATSICFILPRSFKKQSMHKHFYQHYHLIHQHDLPADAFTVNGDVFDVPCVFQIWQRQDAQRQMVAKPVAQGYVFVKREERPHISFRRVGVYAGSVDTNVVSKSIQSHYFIQFIDASGNRLSDQDAKAAIAALENVVFATNNTVGPKSISKPELVAEFNRVLAAQKTAE